MDSTSARDPVEELAERIFVASCSEFRANRARELLAVEAFALARAFLRVAAEQRQATAPPAPQP